MDADLPEYYFRIRENGASVFRINTENRQRRIEMDEIAVINIRSGNIRPHGDTRLTEADSRAIADWLNQRRSLMARRETDDILRSIDQLNQATHWANSRASDSQLDEVTDALLLAMHDLRAVLVRKRAEKLMGADAARPVLKTANSAP